MHCLGKAQQRGLLFQVFMEIELAKLIDLLEMGLFYKHYLTITLWLEIVYWACKTERIFALEELQGGIYMLG